MTKVTIEQWRMFHAVVKYGGFVQAAEKIHKSASSVHYSVTKLENLLNINLIKVEGRKTTLTRYGERVIHMVEKLLEDAKSLEEYICRLSHENDEQTKIEIDECFPISILSKILQLSRQESSLKKLQIKQLPTICSKNDSHSDASLSILQIEAPGCIVHGRCTIRYIAIVSSNHPIFMQTEPLSEVDLSSHTEIRVEQNQDINIKFDTDRLWIVDKSSTALELICEGVGFAWLPEADVKHYINDGRLKQLLFHDRPSHQDVKYYLNVKQDATVTPDIAAFMRFFSDSYIQSLLSYVDTHIQLAS